ncbi:related to 60S ribosomal protein L12, mitochondrial [Cephalotrichum gorgonifer]|uniref:Related to 60S ribosomal protein L12, mitochondrial n=1 Tax=Cephalotrichum gorgonifer TaxID=2041049 RepID=A0AAE8SUE6_9PEZI|nr:related to 60S ribosomal protein L12, mitochondrial [Cephalotrichum gorgonifer]
MSMSYRFVAQRCARQLRTAGSVRPSTVTRIAATSSRYNSTEAAAPENPKIAAIVDQISQLTLLETADLVSSLKSRLNIPDMPMGGFVGGAAPAAAAPVEEAEEAAPAAAEKSVFTLKLEAFDAASKPKVIKEIKNLLGLSLVDSKKFVESAPKVMKENVPKDEAAKIIEALKALGATVTMERLSEGRVLR